MPSWFRRPPIPPLALLALLALAACSPPSTPIEPHLDALGPTRAAPGTPLEARGTFTPATHLEVCETPLDAPRFATEDGTVVSAADAPAPSYPRLLGRVPALAPERVCAVRLVVDGVPREPVDGVRVTIAPPPTVAPGAPTDLVATPRDGAAQIAFTPAGDAVTNHAYSLDDGATWTPLDPPDAAPPVTVPGLANGVPVTIRLRAVNAAGPGAASAPVTVTPVGLPGSPTDLVVSPGDAHLRVTFTPPASTGTSVTNYAYSLDDGATWTPLDPPDAAPPVTVSGLDVGTTYALRLRAVTPAGSGAASAVVRGTPRTTPGAPTALAAWPEAADADAGLPARTVLRFDPPADGGAPIVRYEARRRPADGGAWTAWSPVDGLAASPTGPRGRRVAVTDALPDWDDHVVEVRAVNAAGPGPAAAVDPVTRALVLRGTISSGDV
ncbi:MAG: fibronectin type III domain-containing protein, partial [Trueperaceae bacterium]|nr:fibronectin type III domain-containing protein [Trueperaceae bacterium]